MSGQFSSAISPGISRIFEGYKYPPKVGKSSIFIPAQMIQKEDE
jgi:hypothetical protein